MLRKVVAVAITGVLGVIVAGALILVLPAIGPVSSDALLYSVTRELGGGLLDSDVYKCRRVRGRSWTCEVADVGGSGSSIYEVRRHGRRCWTARRTGKSGTEQPLPRRGEGCVGLRDQVRLFQRL